MSYDDLDPMVKDLVRQSDDQYTEEQISDALTKLIESIDLDIAAKRAPAPTTVRADDVTDYVGDDLAALLSKQRDWTQDAIARRERVDRDQTIAKLRKHVEAAKSEVQHSPMTAYDLKMSMANTLREFADAFES